jgi:4-amino-4-deoxy-L-arabinose transferase-like glycosyltransferase
MEKIDMNQQTTKEAPGYAVYVPLAVATLVLSFWALGYRGLWAAEGRWAEVTRQMLLSGDFFHPNINGQPYFDKPLLTYWLVAAASFVTGTLDEWAVRLPSALALVVTLGTTVWLGGRLWSRQVGLTAGWLLLSTYSVLFWTRTGMADIENMAAIMLAVAWYWTWRDRPCFKAFFGFYLIAFIGAQLKGLTALVVPLAAVMPDVLAERRWRAYLKPAHFLAAALASLVYFGPFLYASMTRPDYHSSGLALVFQENIQRYFDPIDHVEPFYIYFYELPVLLLPWLPLFAGALLATWSCRKALAARSRWLLWAVAMIFLFFSASGSRRSYYILPIVPFCALWMALYVSQAGGYAGIFRDAAGRFPIRLQQGLIMLLGLLELASPLLWPLLEARTGFAAPAGLKTAAVVTGLATLGVLLADRLRPQWLPRLTGTPQGAAGLLVATAVILAGYFCWQSVPLETYRTERPFALELKRNIRDLPPERLVFYEKAEPNVLFYLALPAPPTLLDTPAALQDFLNGTQGEVYLVLRRKTMQSLAATVPQLAGLTPDFAETDFDWQKSSKKLAAYRVQGGQGR